MYYKRYELQLRVSVFFSASILAGAFSGVSTASMRVIFWLSCVQLLAYAVAKMSGIGGYGGWRWIFIIEGLATVVLAIASYWLVPDWPETATFLQPHEREMLIRRLADDTLGATMNRWTRDSSMRMLCDVKIWLG